MLQKYVCWDDVVPGVDENGNDVQLVMRRQLLWDHLPHMIRWTYREAAKRGEAIPMFNMDKAIDYFMLTHLAWIEYQHDPGDTVTVH
jgi:hypothetical protein